MVDQFLVLFLQSPMTFFNIVCARRSHSFLAGIPGFRVSLSSVYCRYMLDLAKFSMLLAR